MVENVTLGYIYLQVLGFCPVSIIPPMLHILSFIHRPHYAVSATNIVVKNTLKIIIIIIIAIIIITIKGKVIPL